MTVDLEDEKVYMYRRPKEKKIIENIKTIPELDDIDKLSDFKIYIKKNKVNLTETIKSKEKYLQLLVNYKKVKKLNKKNSAI